MARRWRPRLGFGSVAALIMIALLIGFGGRRLLRAGRVAHEAANSAGSSASVAWTDRFGDGTPDFLRLSDPADQGVFGRGFRFMAESRAVRPRAGFPAEIPDCEINVTHRRKAA